MQKNKSMSKCFQKKFTKVIIYMSVFGLVVYASSISAFLNFVPIVQAVDPPQMCQVAVDVVLIMDRSGSMADGETPSQCDWWQLEWVCGGGGSFQCVSHNEEGLTEQECLLKPDVPQCDSPVFTAATQSKIDAAKDAANSFLDNLGDNDHSGLVSFSDNVTTDKSLDDNHAGTKSAVNSLTTGGSTNIGDAINTGSQELDLNGRDQAVKAMILLTDGKANKPNGPGHGEWPADVQHALDMAGEAANPERGYKIFTVGLGSDSDINETMLQQIASDTNAQYYHSENGDDLSDIYDEIAWEICQYGSIAGCKYNDLNSNGVIEQGEPTVNGWEVALNNGVSTTTQTVLDGCYTFAGLVDGEYIVSETVQQGWVQTYPPDGFHSVTISGHNDVVDKHFANYFPMCGNNLIDEPQGEICELGDINPCMENDYNGTQVCNQTCDDWELECELDEWCGDQIVNGPEECDDGNTQDGDGCDSQCLIEGEPGPICGNGELEGDEECDDGNTQDGDGCSSICEIEPFCGDGEVNQLDEECDDGNLVNGDDCSDQCLITYQCNDGVDNDADGLTDFPEDPGCDSQDDDNETDMTEQEIQEGDVIINEIAWMGTEVMSSDEWIELRNTTNHTVNLEGWTLKAQDGSPLINLSGTISANGYFLLERSDDDSVPYISADQIYSGTLENGGEFLELRDSENNLIDSVDGSEDWPAGNNSTKQTMERCENNTWNNSLLPNGTPRAVNTSCGEPLEPETGIFKLCKYEDLDGDEATLGDQIPVVDWLFMVSSGMATSTATTTLSGCATFELEQGLYTIYEEIQAGWYLLNQASQGHVYQLNAGQTTQIDFYNTEFCLISGHKYQDLDNNTTTDEYLQNPVSGWEISLFNGEDTETAMTDESGYYEFTELVPGDYVLSEEERQDWLALTPTSTQLTLVSGTSTTTDFINYIEPYCGDGIKNNDEECDGTDGVLAGYYCTDLCLLEEDKSPVKPAVSPGGGGAGPFTQIADVDLEFIYEVEKDLNNNYVESIIVINKGNIVLTNGVLTLDLPEDKLSLIDSDPKWYDRNVPDELAVWEIPAMMVGQELIFEFELITLAKGEAITEVYVVFEQAAEQGLIIERISLAGVGGAPEGEAVEVEEEGPVIGPVISPAVAAEVEGEVAGQEMEQEMPVGEEGEEEVFEQEGTKLGGFSCDWKDWLIIVLLLIILGGGYHLVLKDTGNNVLKNNQPRK